MHRSNYQLSQMAQAHLLKIKYYTVTNFSERQWNAYKDKLFTGFQMLADNPAVGMSCNDLYEKGFYFPIGKHTIYFTKEDGFILVVAVLGQSQLPQKYLR